MTADEPTLATFFPPTLPEVPDPATHTYYSPVPEQILQNKDEPVSLGIDEAGRGPVLGPMVYATAYSLVSSTDLLKSAGFMDSKVLSEDVRTKLFFQMCHGNLVEHVGYAVTSLSPRDISSGMLGGGENLNEQAHTTTIDLIQGVLDRGVNVKEVYVDTVGPPATYQKKLAERFPGIHVVVAKKADSIYPIVSTASVVAKVTRDMSLKQTVGDVVVGSGYPGDAKTVNWLKQNCSDIFGWPGDVVRFSWSTCANLLKDKVEVEWEEDSEGMVRDVRGMFEKKKEFGMEYYAESGEFL